MSNIRAGVAMCGSFCTFDEIFPVIEDLKNKGFDIVPIMSQNAYSTDTRFGTAEEFRKRFVEISGKDIIHTIPQAEPIGPKKLLDILIIIPCTGNTLAKLANGIADTAVTMAAKSHLRNQKPVLIGISTNDALANAAKNIGMLLNYKNVYFIPYRQDDYNGKPTSMIADFSKTYDAAVAALAGKQLQPIITS
ncbi:MAG: dipicolinate synthase subunit B [Clostridiales bacterium]|jgi:dipicolinate synthase subunit B|nr:dipicolinate synthase subunit B [Clostridiales bacterium]HOA33159.1 dipicolinate synthase subunit B [Clostridiales bacterium]HOJ36369.1 dipicolinate synthase subunit B [Clostridiales bacterium]HOL79121.1 dipicolinate synthase subunit B [Clostridiales bacterium]HPP68322.1 dipicolinate synthase subunit B [Clostridiales bacterium]